jgi:hypothetical protein
MRVAAGAARSMAGTSSRVAGEVLGECLRVLRLVNRICCGEEPPQRQNEGGSRDGKEHGRYEQPRGR